MEEAIESLVSVKTSPGNYGKGLCNSKGVKGENSSCWMESLSHPTPQQGTDTTFLKRKIKYGVINTDEYRVGFFFFFSPPKGEKNPKGSQLSSEAKIAEGVAHCNRK